MAAVIALGARFSGRKHSSHYQYFLTDRQVPWWALLGSIVATETSTVTLNSVTGFAFGVDLTFLQLALGYVIGKLAVAAILMPGFFRNGPFTAYQSFSARSPATICSLQPE